MNEMATVQNPTHDFSYLPLEIWSQILDYLIPRGQTFRIKSRRPGLCTPKPEAPNYLSLERYFYSWTTKKWEAWETGRSTACREVLPILLLHPIVYPLALTSLYANNMLWFPDMYTLRHLTRSFSTRAKAAVKALAVDACGMELSFHGCTASRSSWELDADISIVEGVAQFPALRDLRLGGVGPGLTHRAAWSEEWTWRFGEIGPDGVLQRQRIPPGPTGVCYAEARDIWSLHCVALVAGIVNYGKEDQDTTKSLNGSAKVKPTPSLLTGGRIFCAKNDDVMLWNPDFQRGHLRRIGTRIVHRGDNPAIGESEIELVDIPATLTLAKIEDERKRAYQQRKLAEKPSNSALDRYKIALERLESADNKDLFANTASTSDRTTRTSTDRRNSQ